MEMRSLFRVVKPSRCGVTSLEPNGLPKGKKLVTLRDAALYVTKLPKAEHDTEEWQAAMEALLLVAENAAQEQRTKPPNARSGK
jgi:hypothetical protein